MRGFIAIGFWVLTGLVTGSCSDSESNVWISAPLVPNLAPSAEDEFQLTAADAPDERSVSARTPLPADEGLPTHVKRVALVPGSETTRTCRREIRPVHLEKPVEAASGRLLCKVVLDNDVSEAALEVELAMPEAPRRTRFSVRSGHTVRFDRLKPGRATVTVLINDSNFELARIEDVVVPAEGPVVDARLEEIDLRGTLHRMRGRLMDFQGTPQRKVQVRVEHGAHHAIVSTNREGWFSVVVPRSVVTPDVVVKGFQRVRFCDSSTLHLVPD